MGSEVPQDEAVRSLVARAAIAPSNPVVRTPHPPNPQSRWQNGHRDVTVSAQGSQQVLRLRLAAAARGEDDPQ